MKLMEQKLGTPVQRLLASKPPIDDYRASVVDYLASNTTTSPEKEAFQRTISLPRIPVPKTQKDTSQTGYLLAHRG